MTFAKILRIEDLNPQMSPTQLSKHISRPSLLHLHPWHSVFRLHLPRGSQRGTLRPYITLLVSTDAATQGKNGCI